METKKKAMILVCFIIMLYGGMTEEIYPDHYVANDIPFLQAVPPGSLHSFIYKSAYFHSTPKQSIYNHQLGIDYISETHLGGGTYAKGTTSGMYAAVIRNSAITDNAPLDNLSHMSEIFQYTLTGTDIRFNYPIEYIQSLFNEYTMRIPVYSDTAQIVKITIEETGGVPAFTVCQETIGAGAVHYFSLKMSNPSSDGFTFAFECGIVKPTGIFTNKGQLIMTISAGNDVVISNYLVTLGITTATPSFTTHGRPNCKTLDDCVEGYMCNGGTCAKCLQPGCRYCKNNINNCDVCSRHSFLSSPPCEIDYIDLTQYNDIRIDKLPPPRSNRVTLGFWTFITTIGAMTNPGKAEIFQVILKDYFVITIEPSGKDMNAYCSVHEKYYPELGGQTLAASFKGVHKSIDYYAINTVTDVEGRWFYTQCAMSLDQSIFYLNTIKNNVDQITTKSLPKVPLYNTVVNDDHFRIIYNNGDFQQLQINNLGLINTKVYLKNLVLFQEFIPYDIHHMYHDFYSVVTGEDDFPEVLLVIPFDHLVGNTLRYHVKGSLNTESKYDLNPIRIPDHIPPNNFKKLKLLPTNAIYTSLDLSTTRVITPNAGIETLVFQDNKPMSCAVNHWMHSNKQCGPKCDTRYINFPGIAIDRGYCNYQCTGSMACASTQVDTTHLPRDAFCRASLRLFYQCVDDSKEYNAYFSSFLKNSHVVLDFTQPGMKRYDSYFIEFWYFPDFTVNKLRFLKAPMIGGKSRNYLFYTNSIRLYMSTDLRHYLESDAALRLEVDVNTNISPFEWNKIIFNVKADRNGNFELKAYINNNYNLPIDMGSIRDGSLSFIRFCHLDPTNCNVNIYWASGFYKNIKIWDGELTQPKSSLRYDNFYDNKEKRMQSIPYFIPLSTTYFKDNVLIDPKVPGGPTNFPLKAPWVVNWILRMWNYSSKFDYIASLGGGKTLTNVNLVTTNCEGGCLRCWSNTRCYSCLPTHFLNDEYRCIPLGNYYFKSPGNLRKDASIILPTGNEITITFWIKPIGFQDDKIKMIQYGPDLYLEYNQVVTDPNFGLSLIMELGMINILTTIPTFRDMFGQWIFISVAYYYSTTHLTYFPPMIKFEMDANSYEIDQSLLRTQITLDPFIISKDFFGLVFGLAVYDKFIIGAFGYEMSSVNSLIFNRPLKISGKTYLAGSTTPAGCYDSADVTGGDTYGCEPDTDSRFQIVCINNDEYYDFGIKGCRKRGGGCKVYCHGPLGKQCSCTVANSNSQMFMRNKGALFCQVYDYINWARADEVTINVLTAKATERYTMHFWVFPYTYMPNQFAGLEMHWKGHNMISIKQTGGGYQFICTVEQSGGNTQVTPGLPVIINAWNFLSCAVDFANSKMIYVNTNNKVLPESKSYGLNVNTPSSDLIKLATTLRITDLTTLPEWGVLFYRQIRLWYEAYFSAEFLSRIDIQTPSLFPYILHAWEPSYNDDGKVLGIDKLPLYSFKVKHQGTIGTNIVDEKDYVIITLCSEKGQYYDVTTQSCLQFIDLSNMNDFKFEKLPVSYTNNYAMGFWIFTEDFKTLSNGVHVQWTNHMQITVQENGVLYARVFPQGYYSDLVPNTSINDKYSTALNKAEVALDGNSGKWHWVMGGMSNYNKKYYINTLEKDIITETLYLGKQTENPFRFYMMELGETSELRVINIANTKKIYFRSIQLFNDYLPFNYDFKNSDLSLLKIKDMPSLLFVTNFVKFNPVNSRLSYSVYDTIKSDLSIPLSPKTVSSNELSANFIFLPLCDMTDNMYYEPTKNICLPVEKCERNAIKGIHCVRNNTPLICLAANYLRVDGKDPVCDSFCDTGIIRAPGTNGLQGICNTPCPTTGLAGCPSSGSGNLNDYPTNLKCTNNFHRVNYKCVPSSMNANSGLFYSRCYKSPNIYRTLLAGTTAKMPEGYLFEFWFKLDTIYNTCKRTKTKDYYLYATPHTVYLDLDKNEWYYEILGTPNVKLLKGVSTYEWNRFVIQTTLGTAGQNVKFYVNYKFHEPDVEINGIPASSNMQLKSISFCSLNNNGPCTNAGQSGTDWGSAYYRNIRVWNIRAASVQVIQSYNNFMFTNLPKSMILFYPLTVQHMDLNVLKDIINDESIDYTSLYSTAKFYSPDKILFYNYETEFDYIALTTANNNKYITNIDEFKNITTAECHTNCQRCYGAAATTCYECRQSFVLVNQTCIAETGKFVKTPAGTGDTTATIIINPKNTDGSETLTTQVSFTITFYMKFMGIIKEGLSGKPTILSLSGNTELAYDITSTNLILSQNNQVAFEDTNFSKYYGKWIPITISNYISGTKNNVYPNMFTLSVNKIDIPFAGTYTIPASGITIGHITLGNEIIALFAELRIFYPFIQGAYGFMNGVSTDKTKDLFVLRKLYSNTGTTCIGDNDLDGATVAGSGIECKSDYVDYLDATKECNNNAKFFDPLNIPMCNDCHSTCVDYHSPYFCFGSGTEACTCDLTEGYYWLRRNRSPKRTYCEFIPYIDFSILSKYQITDAPVSDTLESTLEFWIFIYSYRSSPSNNFNEINIEWNEHNKVQVKNNANTITAKCYPIYDVVTTGRWTESLSLGITPFQWNLVRCGSDLHNKKYFLNNLPGVIASLDKPARASDKTIFQIYTPTTNNKHSFGFVFIRELKLWRQFNREYIDSSYINIKSYSNYPGLLSHYKNEFKGEYEVFDELKTLKDPDYKPIKLTRVTKLDGYIGYNIVDPDNSNYYSLLVLCEEGFVYNSSTGTCVAPTLTHCEFPGDISDKCLTCLPTEIYLHPADGSCLPECPPKWFAQNKINQCRECHPNCLTCSGVLENECTSCDIPRFLVESLHLCVERCEQYNLTATLNVAVRKCVLFEADAALVNVHEGVPIDINTFTYIEAIVENATSKNYTLKWGFNDTSTLEKNNGSLTLGPTPFADTILNKLTVNVIPTFFQLGYKYDFYLQIIKSNDVFDVIVQKNWTLTMNSPPLNGKLTIIPSIGLYNTTTFVMTCEDWTDDTTTSLQYKFYSIETGTSTIKALSDWSSINEIYSNFTVVYYQQPQSIITIYCEIRDQYNATTVTTTPITIANSISGGIFDLEGALLPYVFPPTVTDAVLLARSEYLKSLGLDTYKTLQPDLLQTLFDPSLDQSLVTKKDPSCTTDYCNSFGYCELVDIFIGCNCDLGYVGRNCHVAKNGYDLLKKAYDELYDKLFAELKNSISYAQFKTLHNLFFGAMLFHQDPKFFSVKLDTFLTLAMNLFQASVLNNTLEYFDLFEYYYSYELTRLVKARLENKNATGYPHRNVTLTDKQQKDFGVSFKYIVNKLTTFLHFIANQYKNTQKTIQYESKNLFIGLSIINPTFSDVNFFKNRATSYKTYVKFMKCLNYVEIEKLTNPYYQAWLVYIEFKNFPYAYNDTLLSENTSPLIVMKFVDATTGKDIIISGCSGENALEIYMPFTSYKYLDILNQQKWLYDPNNYKSPSDPVFSDPIYINETGYISNDTIDMRIEKYKRLYNFSCTYYDNELKAFNDSGITYINFTSDSNYIVFSTDHLTEFTTFFIDNPMNFSVQNRFFYLNRPQIFLYWPNYTSNYAFFVLMALIGMYLLLVFILSIYDNKYFQQESLLEFLKREIVRVFLPYEKEKESQITKLVPLGFNPGIGIDQNYNQTLTKNRRANVENDNYLHNDDTKTQTLNLNKPDDDNTNKDVPRLMWGDESKNETEYGGNATGGYGGFGRKNKGAVRVTNPFINEVDQVESHQITTRADQRGMNDNKMLNSINVNNMPKDFEDSDQEYQARLQSFANLNLSLCQFIGQNLKERHIFISPIINISLFNPRWKKMITLVTENAVIMIMLAIQMTADENVTLGNIGLIVKVSFLSVLAANFLMYLLAVFFVVSYKQRRRLFKLVTSGGQLIVLREWEEMICKNALYTTIGICIHIVIWGMAFYFSISFVAVWSVQALPWIVAFGVSFVIDFLLLECLVEFLIGLIYLGRKNVSCLRSCAEFFNRARNYRCLWP